MNIQTDHGTYFLQLFVLRVEGILLSMHGLGDAIGALLALAFTSLPEGISGT